MVRIPDAVSIEWARDGKTIVYTWADQDLRPCQVIVEFMSVHADLPSSCVAGPWTQTG